MDKIITYQQLLDKGACTKQKVLFKKLFGSRVELTESLVLEHYQSFDVDWAVRNLLSPAALAEYDKVCAPALAEYDKVRYLSLAEYNKVCSPALAEYEKVRNSAWAEYDKVCAPALAEYEKACALAFFKLYKK